MVCQFKIAIFRNLLIHREFKVLIISLSNLLIHRALPRKINPLKYNKLQRPFFNYLIIRALPRKINPLCISALEGVL
nr:MAG TPA: hypothetical protein [Caudoviricetes sp.]